MVECHTAGRRLQEKVGLKVEAHCSNPGCVTVGRDGIPCRQLVLAHSTRGLGTVVYDEDNNIVECPYCGAVIFVDRLAREEQQFPMGKLSASEGAKRILGFNRDDDDALAWMQVGAGYVQRHLRGDIGSYDLLENDSDTRQWSIWNHLGDVVWIITNSARTETIITTPEEYGAL